MSATTQATTAPARPPRVSPLTARQLQELELALERERHVLLERTRAYARAERELSESQREEGSVGGDEADVASDLAEEELVLTLRQAERVRLEAVEAALRRIDERRYGLCESCGQPIAYPRLRALPWVSTCRSCAARAAAAQGGHRAHDEPDVHKRMTTGVRP